MTNEFDTIGSEVAGYLKFPSAGRLTMRSYDDVYGDVYCGWSPHSVRYEPNEKPIFAIFSHCAVGDGGLDQVHEFCWHPDGKEAGIVIYSSAHRRKTALNPSDLYVPDHLARTMATVTGM